MSIIISTAALEEKEWARRYFYQFFIQAWHIIEGNKPYADNWHIKYLCDHLQKNVERIAARKPKETDFIINVPFRSLKSHIFTRQLNAWVWINYPEMRVQSASYSSDLATKHSQDTRKIIQSAWYQKRYSKSFKLRRTVGASSLLKDTLKYFENDRGGFRIVTSVGATATGAGANITIIDDPLSSDQAKSEAERNEANRWVRETMRSRVDDFEVDTTWIIQQRLHSNDPTGFLLSIQGDDPDTEKGYTLIRIPAEDTGQVEPKELVKYYKNGLFFPERFSRKVLDSLKSESKGVGLKAYNAQVQQLPDDLHGNLFKEMHFIPIPREELPKSFDRRGKFWDTAIKNKESNSATAYIDGGVRFGKPYIINVDWKWLTVPAQYRWIKEMGGTIFIEDKASGSGHIDALQEEGIPARAVKVIGSEGDKVERANLILPKIEQQPVYVPEDIYDKLLKDPVQGLLKFPNAQKDDVADAFVMFIAEIMGKTQAPDKKTLNKVIEQYSGEA